MAESALQDLRVLEFGNLVSAAYCTKLMADLGADVIKIEAPCCGDESRRREPFAGDTPGMERSGLFAYLNANKRGITLDPRTAAGKKLFLQLVKDADILVENYPPAEMERMGLTYGEIEKVNPMIVMTSLTPFGQTGPYRDYKAYELNLYQGCGYGYVSTACYREPVNYPIKAGGRQTQFGLALVGAVATISAVLVRPKIGAGQHVDVSGLEVMAGLYESAIQHWTFAQNILGGVSNPILQPMVALECKNGYVYIQCLEEAQFNNFVKVMGEPEWTKNELFKDRFSRAVYIDALIPLLQDWTLQHTKDEIFTMAQEAHVPVAPAYTSAEVINSPQLAARKYLVEIEHPEMGTVRFPGAPYRLSETPWRVTRRAPLLGEHNTDVYCKDLGRSLHDLVKLAQGGAI